MTLTKKKKRILLIALPAALAVIAAAVILWLLLGRDTPKALEPLYNQTTGELMGYTVLEGLSQRGRKPFSPSAHGIFYSAGRLDSNFECGGVCRPVFHRLCG